MGILDLIFGKSNPDAVANSNPLEDERILSVNNAKNEIYNSCLSQLQGQIEVWYKKNATSCSVGIRNDTGVILDKDTMHKVLTKAAYDAAESLNLKYSGKPSVSLDAANQYWTVSVYWQ